MLQKASQNHHDNVRKKFLLEHFLGFSNIFQNLGGVKWITVSIWKFAEEINQTKR